MQNSQSDEKFSSFDSGAKNFTLCNWHAFVKLLFFCFDRRVESDVQKHWLSISFLDVSYCNISFCLVSIFCFYSQKGTYLFLWFELHRFFLLLSKHLCLLFYRWVTLRAEFINSFEDQTVQLVDHTNLQRVRFLSISFTWISIKNIRRKDRHLFSNDSRFLCALFLYGGMGNPHKKNHERIFEQKIFVVNKITLPN